MRTGQRSAGRSTRPQFRQGRLGVGLDEGDSAHGLKSPENEQSRTGIPMRFIDAERLRELGDGRRREVLDEITDLLGYIVSQREELELRPSVFKTGPLRIRQLLAAADGPGQRKNLLSAFVPGKHHQGARVLE